MIAREVLNAALLNRGVTQAESAAMIGWTAQKLSQRLIRNSLRADDFIRLMDALGIEIEFKDKETGEPLKMHTSGYGRRVKGVSDKIQFDTDQSEPLSNSFYEDGVNEFGEDGRAVELYIDKEGRYFFAEYSANEGERDRVRSASASVAAAFIEKYGTDLHKDKKNKE